MDLFSYSSCNVIGNGSNQYSVDVIKSTSNGGSNLYPEVGDEIRVSGAVVQGSGFFGYVDTSGTFAPGPQDVYVQVNAQGIVSTGMTLCTTITPTPTRTRSVTPSKSITPSYTPTRTPSKTPSRTPSRTATPSSSPTLFQYQSVSSEGSGATTIATACGTFTNQTSFWVARSSLSSIQVGDEIYKNSAGTVTWVGGLYYYGIHVVDGLNATRYMRVNNAGEVTNTGTCTSPTPTPTRTPSGTPTSLNAILLGYDADDIDDACINAMNPTTYYTNCSSFANGCFIYFNSLGSKHAPAGYYSDGTSAGDKTSTGAINLTNLCTPF
jgi:hypothetical protein